MEDVPLLVADVYELAGLLRRRGEELAAEVGQTQARWQLLSVVSAGDWTVPDAARRLGVSRQAVQRVADALVADGLLRFEPNPAHRRSPLLRLTRTGADVLQDISVRARRFHRQVGAAVGADEIAALRRGVRVVLEALRA